MDGVQGPGGAASALVQSLQSSLSGAGFDLVQPLQIGWYNALVEPALRLEDFGSEQSLGVVIGNSRALWPAFMTRLQSDHELSVAAHPLQRYTEQHVRRAVSALGVDFRLRWSHDTGARLVAMQRLAHVAGLAYLSPTHLSVHPRFGPWLALRAAVSLDVRAPELQRPELEHPCGSCEQRCLPAFERALAAAGDAVSAQAVRANFPLWLAVRDACPTGGAERYPDAQILYHYLNDREQLLAAARAHAGPWNAPS